ncbi:MAG: DUF4367 domain-containing protein [Dorea sp.]|nr:DUF4367 domain-containing protein [Dorea sp.]
MKNRDEKLERLIKDDYMRAAAEEENVLLKDDSVVPEGKKESIYEKISAEIAEMRKKEKQDLYANMSEEDRRALEIGRRILEEEAKKAQEGYEEEEEITREEVKVVRRRKRRVRVYVAVVAAVVLMLSMGINTMGGPEKLMKMVTQMVGEREVEKVNSSEDNLISVDENEEEAYQKISEEFGIEPVRIVAVSENMKFVNMKFNELMKAAELCYEYDGEKLIYLINLSYIKESFGFDIEYKVIDKYLLEVLDRKIEIKQYQVKNWEKSRFSASFEEMNLKYYLAGTMDKEDFELIVKNLNFFW